MTKYPLAAVVLLFSFVAMISPPITGRWAVRDAKGRQYFINFKADNTFTAYSDKGKVLIVGNYRSDKDTFLVNDNNCNGDYWGKYAMYFHNNDSIDLKILSDTCAGRSDAVDGISLSRLIQK